VWLALGYEPADVAAWAGFLSIGWSSRAASALFTVPRSTGTPVHVPVCALQPSRLPWPLSGCSLHAPRLALVAGPPCTHNETSLSITYRFWHRQLAPSGVKNATIMRLKFKQHLKRHIVRPSLLPICAVVGCVIMRFVKSSAYKVTGSRWSRPTVV